MANVTDINLVAYELVPEELKFYEVPYFVMSEESLSKIQGKYLNTDELTEEQEYLLTEFDALVEAGHIKQISAPVELSKYSKLYNFGFIC